MLTGGEADTRHPGCRQGEVQTTAAASRTVSPLAALSRGGVSRALIGRRAGRGSSPLKVSDRSGVLSRQRRESGAMSCGELFQVFSTRSITSPAMPVDFAMRLCLTHSPPIRKLLNSYEELRSGRVRKPLRSCLNLKPSAEPERRDSAKGSRNKKKRVVFADMKGLSLTAVRFFSKIEEDLCDLQQALSDLTCFRPKLRDLRLETKKYTLDFPQPSADYMAFRSRLHSHLVCLENCLIQEQSLSGTIKVRNISYEKKVHVRITFDSWRSFRDVCCQYMHNTYGAADADTFSFDIALSKAPSLRGPIEFCISFQCGQKTYWDNNCGSNYKIRHTSSLSSPSTLSQLIRSSSVAGEQLGTSKAAALVLSHLHTWRHLENHGPYW
uniref:Protein phosphatase 1 regulatory subunit n=1 Tax=Pelusios castaneus TaxID=367368 RepID=A0A8C8VPY0_9SAUR